MLALFMGIAAMLALFVGIAAMLAQGIRSNAGPYGNRSRLS
jgi:hypothetical protein